MQELRGNLPNIPAKFGCINTVPKSVRDVCKQYYSVVERTKKDLKHSILQLNVSDVLLNCLN